MGVCVTAGISIAPRGRWWRRLPDDPVPEWYDSCRGGESAIAGGAGLDLI